MGKAARASAIGDSYGSDFETAVLWLLLFDEDFSTGFIPGTDETLFSTDAGETLYLTAKALFEENKNVALGYVGIVSRLALARKRLKDGTSGKTKVEDAIKLCGRLYTRTPYNANEIDYVKKTITQFILRGKVKTALLESATLWEKDKFDEVLQTVDSAVHANERTLGLDLGINFGDTRQKLLTYIGVNKICKRCPLDIPLIDNAMLGGLSPGMLGLVIAPSHRGKSLFLTHVGAASLSSGLSVAMASFELLQADYAKRFDARLTGVPINEISSRPHKYASAIAKVTSRMTGNLHIKHWGSHQATVMDLYVWLRALKSKYGFEPNIVLVDYADLMKFSERRGDRPDVGHILRSLRQLGQDMNCVVWTASQVQRSSYDSPVLRLDHVAEDIQKVDVSDAILALCQTEKEKARRLMRLVLLKDRVTGNTGTMVDCVVNTETMTLRQSATQSRVLQTFGAKP